MSQFEKGRTQRARVHHVCCGGHVILPGDRYVVEVELPGSGSYAIGGGDFEPVDWPFGWVKLCTMCENARHGYGDDGTMPPIHRALCNRKYAQAFETALRHGHRLVCDHEANARFTCTECGHALLMPTWGVVYGSAIETPCTPRPRTLMELHEAGELCTS